MATENLDIQNFYQDTLKDSITAEDTIIYLNSVPSVTEGYLVLSPDDPTRKEIIYYNSVNSSAGTVTCPSAELGRGLGGTTAQIHTLGETVKMNINAEYWKDLQSGEALASDAIVTRHLEDDSVTSDKIEPQEAWHEIGATGEPAFTNSWVNHGTTYNSAAFMKDSMGFVHIKGFIKSGASGSVAFTLPVGYRPVRTYWFPTMGNDIIGKTLINSAGQVLPYGTGVTSWSTMDGITFKAEQ